MAVKPDSLESKFKLMQLLPFDKRMRRKHMLVYGFILDWFHSKYGDALASARHVLDELKKRDPFGQGLFMGDVHSALTDLVAWGYLSQDKGSGRKASRYIPIWSVFSSVRETQNATNDEFSVRETPNASVRETPNATGDSVRESQNEDPLTVTRPQDEVTGKEGYDCAAPLAPPLSGLTADTAGAAQGGFEELWKTYAYRQKKKEAQAAYTKLSPDPDQHAAMVLAASQWQTAWAAQGKADAPRFTLAKWIEREEFECGPPTAYKSKERKAATVMSTISKPAVRNVLPPERRTMKITEAGLHDTGRRACLCLTFEDSFGEVFQEYELTHYEQKRQEAGNAEYLRLLDALGLADVDDPNDLVDETLVIRRSGMALTYESVKSREAA